MSCYFYNGTPGSCRNGDQCPYGHGSPAGGARPGPGGYNPKPAVGGYRGNYDRSRYVYVAKPSPNTSPQTQSTSLKSSETPAATLQQTSRPATSEERSSSDVIESFDRYVYSENLTAHEREAYEGSVFQIGSIPFNPPTKELV